MTRHTTAVLPRDPSSLSDRLRLVARVEGEASVKSETVYVVGTRVEGIYPNGRLALVLHSIHTMRAEAELRATHGKVVEAWVVSGP